MIYLFLFSAVFLTLIEEIRSGCSLSDQKPTNFNEAKNCILSNPFSTSHRDQTLDAVITLTESYIYRDINTNSPAPYNIQVDLVGDLGRLRSKTFENDYDFHVSVQKVFKKLRDSHTMYVPPVCYAGFTFYLPFGCYGKRDEENPEKMKFFVTLHNNEDVRKNYSRVYPDLEILIEGYKDWEITQIDGMSPLDFFLDNIELDDSYSRDKSVRFNDVFTNFFQTGLLYNTLPSKEAVSFSLRDADGKTVVVHPKFMATTFFNFVEKDWNKICFGTKDKRRRRSDFIENAVEKNSEIFQLREHENFVLLQKRLELTHRTEINTVLPGYNQILKTDDVLAYIKEGGEGVGVLVVKSFMPSSPRDYVDNIKDALEKMKTSGVKKVLVDVRANGGGIICLGWVLANLLSKYAPKAMYPLGDQYQSQWWNKFYCKKNKDAYRWSFLSTSRKPVKNGWLAGPHRKRGDADGAYTNMFSVDCNMIKNLYGFAHAKSPMQLEPENLIILTDGKCGSTCGMFITMFKILKLGKIVQQGGIIGEDLAIASFKAASVYDSSNIFDSMKSGACKACKCQKIPKFPEKSMMTFAWYEIYPYTPNSIFNYSGISDEIPMGYTRRAGDERIYQWDFSWDNPEIYELSLPVFDKCYSWEVKRNDGCEKNPIPHGVYGNPCVEGKFVPTECVLRGCDEDYYLSAKGDRCLLQPKEYPMWSKFLIYYIGKIFVNIVLPLFLVLCCCCCCCCICCICCCVGIGYAATRKRSPYVELVNEERYIPPEIANITSSVGVLGGSNTADYQSLSPQKVSIQDQDVKY